MLGVVPEMPGDVTPYHVQLIHDRLCIKDYLHSFEKQEVSQRDSYKMSSSGLNFIQTK
jgi:hypothetical protein